MLFTRGNSTQANEGKSTAAAAAAAVALVGKGDDAALCRSLAKALLQGSDQSYEIGRTRVYFKAGVLEDLEERRALLLQAAATELSRAVRGYWARRTFAL